MVIVEVTRKDEFINLYEFPDDARADEFIKCLATINMDYQAKVVN